MSDMLARLGLLALVAVLPAASMIAVSRRQRAIIGGVGVAVGIACQLIGGDTDQHPEAFIAMVVGYAAAMGALMAEIVNWCFRKLGAGVRALLAEPNAAAKDKP